MEPSRGWPTCAPVGARAPDRPAPATTVLQPLMRPLIERLEAL